MQELNLHKIADDWRPLVTNALKAMDQNYLQKLGQTNAWLPGANNILNAFQLPLAKTRYILFGESPYPRPESANGYAFWDGAVHELWSPQGLSKKVNRATSLRNIIKMLFVARGNLKIVDTSQIAIAKINKTDLVITIDELFKNFLNHGIMLLNACLVLSNDAVKKEALYWHIFMESILSQICELRPDIKLILWGKVAKAIETIPAAKCFKHYHAEHPYNLSFIGNQKVIDLFKPFDLLKARDKN